MLLIQAQRPDATRVAGYKTWQSLGLPVFRRMVASHERALTTARERGEPAGQIAAREMEVSRIRTALRRAEELTEDVAAAIENAAN